MSFSNIYDYQGFFLWVLNKIQYVTILKRNKLNFNETYCKEVSHGRRLRKVFNCELIN